MLEEATFEEIIGVIAVIIVSQIIGWLNKKKNKFKVCCIVTGIVSIFYILFTFDFSDYLIIQILFILIFTPFLFAGMSIPVTLVVYFFACIIIRIRLKYNPLRIYIIDQVKAAKKNDPYLSVTVNNDRVSIFANQMCTDIIFNDHGYENANDNIKNYLIKNIKSNLGINYIIDENKIIHKNIRSLEKSKETNQQPKHKKW